MNELKILSREDQEILSRRGYDTVRLLGVGAFSQVILIRKNTDYIACKISSRTALARREAQILERIDHPLFPKLYHVWQEGEKVFLLMEYVCGSSLEALLRRRGCFSDAQTLRIGLELAEGLKYLHELSEPLLFRDVKPANILLRQDGRVKLLDLGCACGIGRQSNLAGTPEFAAPEQLESGSYITEACDVYGLGRTLQAVAGENCGKKLKQALDACTKEEPRERIPDMRGVVSALGALIKEDSGMRRPRVSFPSRATCINNVWESAYKGI